MIRLIGLAGEAGSGKGVFASIAKEFDFTETSFADNLKEMLKYTFNLSDFHLNTPEGKLKVLSPSAQLNKEQFKKVVKWMQYTMDENKFKLLAPVFTKVEKKLVTDFKRLHGKYIELKTAREIMQFIGTDICRLIYPEYHINVLINRIKNSDEKLVISDARFPNERIALRSLGAKLVRIKRNNIDKLNHESEQSFGNDEEYDVVLLNNSSLDNFKNKIRTIFQNKEIQ